MGRRVQVIVCLLAVIVGGCASFSKRSANAMPAEEWGQQPRRAGRIDWSSKQPQNARVRLYLASSTPGDGLSSIEHEGTTLFVAESPLATQADILHVWVLHGAGESIVQVQLSELAAAQIRAAGRAAPRTVIAIYADDKLLACVAQRHQLPSGNLVIRERFTRQAAQELAATLRGEPQPAKQSWIERLFGGDD